MRTFVFLIYLLLFAAPGFSQSQGNDCHDPIPVLIGNDSNFPIVLEDSTCGRGNDAENTCLGTYDGGEDVFYELTVEFGVMLEIYLDPLGTNWTGIVLSEECPPSGEVLADCLYGVTGSGADPRYIADYFLPGVYYLMIDSWPPPDCIPAYRLTIIPLIIDPFYTCEMPYMVRLPNDAPFTTDFYTCGLMNDYDQTCLGNFDGGEDIIFEVEITVPGEATFTLDPKESTFTGMVLDSICPASGGAVDCMALSTSIPAEPHSIEIFLEIGTYYLMVDTWPQPDCIPDFNIFMNLKPLICGDVNDDEKVNVSDAVYNRPPPIAMVIPIAMGP